MKFELESNTLNAIEEENIVGYIDFELENNILNVTHTFVDPSQRGKGLAKLMMNEIYNYSKKNNYQIKASCSYAIKYLENLN